MENAKCFICNSNFNAKTNNNATVNKNSIGNAIHMSCNHIYCSKCLTRIVILKHLTQFQFNKSIRANCLCEEGFIELNITQIEQIASQSNTLLSNLTCSIHINEKQKMYCKDCLMILCSICAKSEPHYQHQIILRDEIIATLKSSILNLPLQFKSASEFASSFDSSIESFKSTINAYLNNQLSQIDELISQLTSLKQEYIAMIKSSIDEWDKYLNVLKQLHLVYFKSYERFSASDDFNELKFVNNIRNDFKKLKARVNNQNEQQMKDMLQSITNMKSNTKDIFDIEIVYNELPKHYNICYKLLGHKGQIYTVIQLRDGRLCTGADDYTIRFWEKIEGRYKNTDTISEYTGEVVSLIQLNDNRIISCSKDNNAFRIWIDKENRGKYSCAGTLSEHLYAVTSLYQLSDNRLMTTSEDYSIKLWNTHQNLFQCSHTLKEHSQTVYCCIELTGKRLASASADCSIRIWEEINGVFFSIHILKTQKKKMRALLWLRNALLVSGGKDGVVLFWKENEDEVFECVYSINNDNSDVGSLIQLRDNRMVCITKKGSMKVWLFNDSQNKWIEMEELSVYKKQILSIIELDDGVIVSTTNDRVVYLWRDSFYLD